MFRDIGHLALLNSSPSVEGILSNMDMSKKIMDYKELELKMPEEIVEESDTMSPIDPFQSGRVFWDRRCPGSSKSTGDEVREILVSSRKRSIDNDFLPIDIEIKRIGVEISEEETMRNYIRRLSPMLVSLREGKLGCLSRSCFFGDEFDNKITIKKTICRKNRSKEASFSRLIQLLDNLVLEREREFRKRKRRESSN